MNRVLTRKLALAISMAAMAVLAAAVLLWGVEYKCSLYRLHPEQQRRVAVAKLLSEKERPLANPTESLLSAPLSLVAWSALWLFLTAQGRIDRAGRWSAPLASPRLFVGFRVSCLSYFSFRPPPTPAF